MAYETCHLLIHAWPRITKKTAFKSYHLKAVARTDDRPLLWRLAPLQLMKEGEAKRLDENFSSTVAAQIVLILSTPGAVFHKGDAALFSEVGGQFTGF